MKKSMIIGIVVAGLLTAPAMAADLPVKASSPAPMALPYNWTGFYVGGSLGAAVALGTVNDLSGSLYGVGATGDNHNVGAIIGANVGYNFQAGNLVYGLETDISYNTAKSVIAVYNVTPDDYLRSSSNSLITARARVGYAFDRTLAYVTGGLAVSNLNVSATGNFGFLSDYGTAGVSGWRTGWIVGAGLEHAITQNWTVRAEGLYVDFGSRTAWTVSDVTQTPMGFRFNDQELISRVGVNYKF
jgi:outer membrane immunogenic protein